MVYLLLSIKYTLISCNNVYFLLQGHLYFLHLPVKEEYIKCLLRDFEMEMEKMSESLLHQEQ